MCSRNFRSIECEKWKSPDMFSWPSLLFYKWGNWNPETQCLPPLNPLDLAPNELVDLQLAVGKSTKIIKSLLPHSALHSVFLTLSLLIFRYSVLSSLLHIKVSHSSVLRLTHLAMYFIPLLSSPEFFALTNHKLWNCGMKNYLALVDEWGKTWKLDAF